MHIIMRKRVNEFAAKHPKTKSALAYWYANVRKARVANFVELRQTFVHADQVGKFTVFDIAGNKFDRSRRCIMIETRFTFGTC